MRQVETDPRLTVAARDVLSAARLRIPGLSSILITGVDCPDVVTLSSAVCAEAAHGSHGVTRLHLDGGSPEITADFTGKSSFEVSRLADPESVRDLIRDASHDGLFVASSADFLQIHESRTLAALVEGVVLVARSGRTRERDLREAARQMAAVGANLLGSVFVEQSLA